MNISYNWLKDLVEINLSPQELATKLTNVGLVKQFNPLKKNLFQQLIVLMKS